MQGTFPGFGVGIGGRFAGFLANPLLEQIFVWQVLQQITGAILTPEMAGLTQEIFRVNPSLQLPLSEAVNAVIRGHLALADGATEAALSGIKASRFQTLVDNAGEPPGIDFLTFAYRRHIIPEKGLGADSVSLEQGIRESALKNKWAPVIEAMQFIRPSVGDTVDAWVQNQITEAVAREILLQNGIADADATILYDTRGRPPGPGELIEMARRGKIPVKGKGPTETSLEQGIYESAAKDKWEPVYEALMEYLPPPRTITAMLRAGTFTDAEALDLFQRSGLTEALAAKYVANAHHEATHATRELVKADVLTLYAEGVYDKPTAATHLESLGYSAAVAEFELEAIEFRYLKGLIDKVVGRVHSLYVAHKIDGQAALTALDQVNIPAAQRDQLLQVWGLERADNVATLTAAEVVHAAKLNIYSEAQALAELATLGWGPHDAWVRLGLGLGAIPNTPEPA
jgi:hypothetical protein